MTRRNGDRSKQPPECDYATKGSLTSCQHMKEVGGGFEGERYRCDLCGAGYYLDYDEMR